MKLFAHTLSFMQNLCQNPNVTNCQFRFLKVLNQKERRC